MIEHNNKYEPLLRKLRGKLAYAKQMEPFRVFRDEELVRLLDVEPHTLEELATIKGFPFEGARVQKYGQSIIDIFNEPDNVTDFEVTVDSLGDPVASSLKRMSLF